MKRFSLGCNYARLLIGFLLIAAAPGLALAHDPGLSSANMEVRADAIDLQLTFNERDIAGALATSPEELRSGSANAVQKLDAIAHRAVALEIAGQSQAIGSVRVATDANNNIEFCYQFAAPLGNSEVKFESLLLKELSFGHRQAFAATDVRGNEIARQILSAREAVVTISLRGHQVEGNSARGSRFREFFTLGIRHILTGYDHLLFLFGLLIVCRTLRSALLLITCFTVAHSLTLALSTFGLVSLSSRVVEATIAASILYVGVENLLRRDGILRGRWLLTFAFGLIHGLGFASVLHEMGIAKTGLSAVVPLVAFNSGVEVGQLAVAAIVLPLIWQARRRPAFVRVGVPVGSALVAAAGAYWLLERTLL